MPKLVPKPASTNCYAKTSHVPTLFGIPNCDKCRAARQWFAAEGIEILFHDLRADGLDASLVEGWLNQLGFKALINTRSKTWRDLPAKTREQLNDSTACELILQYPTLIKRPLVDTGSSLLVGYDEASWANLT
jgi:arsenate reductase